MQQNETLLALGERIVPGSAVASCNRVIDLLMIVESDKTKRQLVTALKVFNLEAVKLYAAKFRDLRPEQQDAILQSALHDQSLNIHFHVVKEWVADTYWTSQQGMRLRGWNGRITWESYPACPHPAANS